jgi:carbon-monoxide dehydrogenase large subunit
VFSKALEQADLAGFAKRKKDSRKRGKLRGIAVGSYLEITAPPSAELGKIVFEADGAVNLITGTLDYGQGHATPFAQVLATELGVPFDAVRLTRATAILFTPATAPAARARSPQAARPSWKPRNW